MTFDELFKDHTLTPAERQALVLHLALCRAQRTIAALTATPTAPHKGD